MKTISVQSAVWSAINVFIIENATCHTIRLNLSIKWTSFASTRTHQFHGCRKFESIFPGGWHLTFFQLFHTCRFQKEIFLNELPRYSVVWSRKKCFDTEFTLTVNFYSLEYGFDELFFSFCFQINLFHILSEILFKFGFKRIYRSWSVKIIFIWKNMIEIGSFRCFRLSQRKKLFKNNYYSTGCLLLK